MGMNGSPLLQLLGCTDCNSSMGSARPRIAGLQAGAVDGVYTGPVNCDIAEVLYKQTGRDRIHIRIFKT